MITIRVAQLHDDYSRFGWMLAGLVFYRNEFNSAIDMSVDLRANFMNPTWSDILPGSQIKGLPMSGSTSGINQPIK